MKFIIELQHQKDDNHKKRYSKDKTALRFTKQVIKTPTNLPI